VFNINGLTNEYSGMCQCIKSGELVHVDALGGYEKFTRILEDGDVQPHEAFYTSGCTNVSLNRMLQRDIQNFDYKTVRYEGHLDYIKFLMQDCKIVGEAFSEAIMNCCPETREDWVYTQVITDNLDRVVIIEHDDQWTAMQKGTGFPTAAVAAIIAEMKEPKVWEYEDISLPIFSTMLEKITDGEFNI
jgi:saccharopine dehydrogenase-like NADP-dependent oxidoreductase